MTTRQSTTGYLPVRLFVEKFEWKIRITFALMFSVTLIYTPWSAPLWAAEKCPRPQVTEQKRTDIAYKWRGDRCEGLYVIEVASRPRPQIIGFHTGLIPAASFKNSGKARVIVDASTGSEAVSLRAVSLRPKTYYAMDTELPRGQWQYQWDSTILSMPPLNMRTNELGLLACTNDCRPDQSTKYFPAKLEQPAPTDRSQNIAIIRSSITLRDVSYTVQRVGGDVVLSRKLSGRFTAARPILLPLGNLGSGRYHLRFTGKTLDRAPTLASFTLVIP